MFDGLAPRVTSAERWEMDPLAGINRRLAGFWPILDGRSARDISGRGRHGTFSAAVAMRAAKWGKAPGFIATGGGNAALGPIITIGSAFSLSFWAMGDNASGTGSITQPFSTDNVFNTSRITFSWDHTSGSYNQGWNGYGGGSYPVVKYTTALAANTPYLLGFTYDGNNLAIFLNGRQEGSVAIGALAAASGALAFGGTPGNAKYWAGRAGLLRWADRIWTPAEWRTLYREPWAGTIAPGERLFHAVKRASGGAPTALTATDLATGAPTVGSPSLGQTHALTATGIATAAPTVGGPALGQTHDLTATGVATGAPTAGSPAIGQTHALAATGVAVGAPTVGSPAIGQTHALTATGIATGAPTVGSPALGQTHALTAAGVATGAPVVGVPAVGQTHSLVALGIAAGVPVVGSPALNAVVAAASASRTIRLPARLRSVTLATRPRHIDLPARSRVITLSPERD